MPIEYISSAKIKRFAKKEHTVDEHIEFIYKALYELYERLEEIESELKGENNKSAGGMDKIQVKLW